MLRMEENSQENIICRLCFHFQAENDGDYFTVTKCGHAYHNECLQEYLSRGKLSCPTCSHTIYPKHLTKLYGVDPHPIPHSSREPLSNFSKSLNNYTYSFKIVILGNSGVGKSCILRRFYDNTFSTSISYTGGADLVRKIIHMGDDNIQLIIWDTIGQEKFKSVISTCVRDAHGIIFVYDVRRRETLRGLNYWWQFADDYTPNAVKILLGNKIDLVHERVISEKEGEEVAKQLEIPFMETSAKDAKNVEAAFRILTAKILENKWVISEINNKMGDSTIQLDSCGVGDAGLGQGCVTMVKNGLNEVVRGLRAIPDFISELKS